LIYEVYEFDRKLRKHCLAGLEIIEIYLRARISYLLGKVHPMAHIDIQYLDTNEPHKLVGPAHNKTTLFEKWEKKLKQLTTRSLREDFVQHHNEVLKTQMPIWVVSELFDFGATEMLYSLLDKKMQNEIAAKFDIRTGRFFGEVISSFSSIRNFCAHYGRLWNRVLPIVIGKFNGTQVPKELEHLVGFDEHKYMYSYLTLIAHVTEVIEGNNSWSIELVQLLKTFPNSDHVSLENNLNFPEKWKEFEFWKRAQPTPIKKWWIRFPSSS
jgi:abortive infection bacteriophage resistance protein